MALLPRMRASQVDGTAREWSRGLEAFAISEGQGNTVTKGIKQIIFSVAVLVSDAEAFDLVEKVVFEICFYSRSSY